MASAARARWWNPTSGAYTDVAVLPNTGQTSFTTPDDNGSGENDWVLILTPAAESGSTASSATSVSPHR